MFTEFCCFLSMMVFSSPRVKVLLFLPCLRLLLLLLLLLLLPAAWDPPSNTATWGPSLRPLTGLAVCPPPSLGGQEVA